MFPEAVQMAFSSSARFVGCCGWPEGKAKYFTHFPVVELQSTFYELPSIVLAEKWRALAPESFQFCMKAWQVITHTPSSPTYRKLKSRFSPTEQGLLGSFRPSEQVRLAWEQTAAIARVLRASVVVLQCPKSFEPSAENLRNMRQFFSDVGKREFVLAWEPRGEWRHELVRDLCAEYDLVHCVDPLQTQAVYGGLTYWRLHGVGGYHYRYSDAELEKLQMLLAQEGTKPSYVMFNNVWMKEDSQRFQAILASHVS